MSRGLRLSWLAGLLLCLASVVAWGSGPENMLNGESTLIFAPTTDTLTLRSVTGALTWVENDDASTFPILNVLYGVSPEAEVGLGFATVDPDAAGADTLNQWHLIGKYRFREETKTTPALAIEARYQDYDAGELWGLNLLGSLRLNKAEQGYLLRAHAMLGWQDAEDESDVVPAIGIQYLSPTGWEAALEYTIDNDVYGDDLFAAQLRYRFRPELDANIGLGSNGRVFVGVRYLFQTQ